MRGLHMDAKTQLRPETDFTLIYPHPGFNWLFWRACRRLYKLDIWEAVRDTALNESEAGKACPTFFREQMPVFAAALHSGTN